VSLTTAVRHAEHLLGLAELRADCGEIDPVDGTTGEDPLLRHVRTRIKSPQTKASSSGSSAPSNTSTCSRTDPRQRALAVEAARFRQIYNTIRPHQGLHDRTPRNCRP
jgi:hypothetical protein